MLMFMIRVCSGDGLFADDRINLIAATSAD
jgi:hypothetical protein